MRAGRPVQATPEYLQWIKRAAKEFRTTLEVLDSTFVRKLEQELSTIERESGMTTPDVPRRLIKETREFLEREVELIEREDWEALYAFHDRQFKPYREIEYGFIKKKLQPFFKRRREETPISELDELHPADITREFMDKFLESNLALVTNGISNWEKYGPEGPDN